ncbi:hypothetical protein BDZ90DRAFT_231922 [Jaminaea rosea]|uniref:PRP1 splicing factor N-terminal domain-containing protein n=1 Tax=Jaminaea rosea TaxID=1569628 RepID=A0A316UW68_9BASI|nr:hypothetical protein BDZ90DRAFT_231922 [Jaminaea rosea]PWN28163.1 hypothetical protein BDZ90DRAFT_231922 [Jaminaea rosea]
MAAPNQANKHAFLSMAPPPNYVAGLGRGASGFTTRSDIGPARQQRPDDKGKARADGEDGDGDDEGGAGGGEEGQFDDRDPENETGLFAGGVYEKDDEEADRIWEAVDNKMDERRRDKREAKEREEMEKLRAERPKIQAQFADLKRGLGAISQDEWAALPEPGNLTGKKRKKAEKREARETGRSYVVPDSVLLGARDQNATVSEDQTEQGTTTSLTEIGEARNKVFSHNLDQAGTKTSLGGTASTIDPQGYLTSLSSLPTQSTAEIGDIKRARSLYDSLIKTNPSHAPGWISAARLEERAGKMVTARKIIAQGCEHCAKSEDIWLENARLNGRDNGKVVLAQATQALRGQSVKIWLAAMDLETDPESKKRVLRKSLEFLPTSVTLWKKLVSLESDPGAARVLLSGAVGAIPSSESLWLALARISTPDEAKQVLNEARRNIPTSHAVWIAGARLTEQTSEAATDATQKQLDGRLAMAVRSLTKAGAVLSRDQWMEEALRTESEGSPMTATAIINATLDIGMDDDEERRIVWVQDAEAAKERGNIAVARAIVAYTLRLFPDRGSVWRFAVDLEKELAAAEGGDISSLEALLERAVSAVPKNETLWLIYAKSKWERGDVPGARQILIRAFQRNLGSEDISLAAAKLEFENGEKNAARSLLERARGEVGSARVWIKSAVFERDEGQHTRALEIVVEGLAKHDGEPKLWLMRAQLLQHPSVNADPAAGVRAARDALTKAVKSCPHNVDVWLASSRLEESANLTMRARAVLEKARLSNPRNDSLWLESARIEDRSGNAAEYRRLLSRGLQECPASGKLWAESIFAEPRPTRKTRSADALKKTGDDARVLCAVAQLFWVEGKYEKARQWFERSVRADVAWGDGYAWWLKFEKEQSDSSEEKRQQIVEAASRNEAKYGEVFQQVNKSEGRQREKWGMEKVLDVTAQKLVLKK